MKYLLDTNTCVVYLRGRSPKVKQQIQSVQPHDIALCSIVKAELVYGALRSANPARTIAQQNTFWQPFVSFPFDDHAADVYGRIRADLAAQSFLIGPNDLMIAAIAFANSLTLVTHNTREFRRVPGLHLEDWEAIP